MEPLPDLVYGLSLIHIYAQALLDATVASEDGKGVTSSEYWATQSEIDTFSAAIKAAQAVVDKEDASKEEVEAAVSALESAQSGFDRTQGSASFSSAPLTEAIKAAEALLASVEPVSYTHLDVYKRQAVMVIKPFWASPESRVWKESRPATQKKKNT